LRSAIGVNRSYVQENFLLAKYRAGDIEIGMTIDALHTKHPPSSTKLVAHYPEGEFSPMLEIYLEGATNQPQPSLLIGIGKKREWIVDDITVNDARFRTPVGIGVGSTLGDIRKVYTVRWIGFGEGPLCANVDEIGMTFALDFTDPPPEWHRTKDQRLIPDRAKVISIRLYRSPTAKKK
jgi:hypothetical protein